MLIRYSWLEMETVLAVSLGHYLTLCILLLFVGLFGALVNRRQILMIFLSFEIAWAAGILLFVAFSKYQQNLKGQAFAVIVLGVLMVKTILGIALILTLYKKRRVSFAELEKKDEVR